MQHLRILRQFWKAAVMQAMEYRTSFLLGILANSMDFFFGLIQYLLFFSVAHNIAGWGLPQMLALYAVFMTIFSLHFVFLYPNLEEMSLLVNSGRLDLVLCRPFSAQIVLSFRRLSFEELGSFFAAQILLAGLIVSGRITVSIYSFIAFLVTLFCSTALVYALFLFFLALTIKWEKMENLSELMWSFFGFTRYPVQIYPRWLRGIFWSLFPLAFVVTVPAQTLAHQPDLGTIGIGVLLTVIFSVFSRICWKKALRGYSSAGG